MVQGEASAGVAVAAGGDIINMQEIRDLLELPSHIHHIIFDLSKVIVPLELKRQMLKAETGESASFKPPAWYPNLISSLKERFTFGILSNTSVPDLYLKYLKLDKYFSPRVFTLWEAPAKPHPDAFRRYLEKVKVPAENIAMVDDRPCNLVVAKSSGIYTVWARLPEHKDADIVHQPLLDAWINWHAYLDRLAEG